MKATAAVIAAMLGAAIGAAPAATAHRLRCRRCRSG